MPAVTFGPVIVTELWRFPVKSLGGERVERVGVTGLGLDGDRRWGVVDRTTGRVLTARREPRLLFASARLVAADRVAVTLPDGTETDRSEDLAAWLDRDVALERAGDVGGVFEAPHDAEREADWVTWQGPPGAWHDSRRSRLSLVTLATLGAWDRRRFRSNVVLDGSGEDGLVGQRVKVGSCLLDVTKQIDRCVMVTRAQPGVPEDRDVLREIVRERATFLAVGALVADGGHIAVGDVLGPA